MKARLFNTGLLSVYLAVAGVLARHGVAQPPAAGEERLRKVVLCGEERDTLGRLHAADRLIARKSWVAGVDEYLRLINECGDELVPEQSPTERTASTRRSVRLRLLCHLRIAALPPEARRHYRERVDGRARRGFERGAALHDLAALRRVVDEAGASPYAERAIDLLGDLAFERGNFAQARGWWRLVATPPDETGIPAADLLFPEPQVDVARVRAKQVLALLFQGEVGRARTMLRAFRRVHGRASGWLAGRAGNYAAMLQSLLDERAKGGPLSPEEDDWPTFAGSPSRNRPLDAPLSPALWANGPSWRVPLGPDGDADDPAGEPAEPRTVPARRLAFYPVISGRLVLVADARRVLGFDMQSGRRVFHYDLKTSSRPGLDTLRLRLPAPKDLRYTLSVADGRAYARLGAQGITPQGNNAPAQAPSYLVCLDLPSGRASKEAVVRERWVVAARSEGAVRYAFEGAPLVYDGRVYAAESRRAGGWTRTAILCLRADNGAVLWRQDVCETPDAEDDPAPRARHYLLTLAGTAVVYCSHAGAVVSLDAASGKRLWGVRYPSRGPDEARASASARDLCPCVAVGRRLFVAPLDSSRIFCLDAQTGRTLWEREGIEPVHVLGVSAGRLLFTTAGGLRALDAATGADEGGWRQPAVGRLAPFGRGLLMASWVMWPTQDPRLPLRALNEEDGTARRGALTIDPTRLHRLRPGNLAYGSGCLVAADMEELLGYVPDPTDPARTSSRGRSD